jgi:hypothetical protein
MGAGNGRNGGDAYGVTKFESAYGIRRARQQADDAGQTNKGGICAAASVAHLACRLFLVSRAAVVHRTSLARRKPATAFIVVARRGRLAAERQGRGRNAGDLAGEPEARNPRDATAYADHAHLPA